LECCGLPQSRLWRESKLSHPKAAALLPHSKAHLPFGGLAFAPAFDKTLFPCPRRAAGERSRREGPWRSEDAALCPAN